MRESTECTNRDTRKFEFSPDLVTRLEVDNRAMVFAGVEDRLKLDTINFMAHTRGESRTSHPLYRIVKQIEICLKGTG
jgi:hypothetical protein